MRTLIVLLALSLSTAFAEAPKLAVDSQHLVSGELMVQVRNDSEVAATAFLVGTSDKSFMSTDTVLGARDGRALKPGETAEVRVPHPETEDASVMAAVFEDGTVIGGNRWVEELMAARREVHQELPIALTLLRQSASFDFTSAAVAFWFQQWQDRWHASDSARSIPVFLAAETFLKLAGSRPAEGPVHELTQVFEELSAKLAKSKPEL
jgi:hypothetical protein